MSWMKKLIDIYWSSLKKWFFTSVIFTCLNLLDKVYETKCVNMFTAYTSMNVKSWANLTCVLACTINWLQEAAIFDLPFTAGEFGVVYRARLTRSTLRKTDCEIVAVKTIKGKDRTVCVNTSPKQPFSPAEDCEQFCYKCRGDNSRAVFTVIDHITQTLQCMNNQRTTSPL